MEFWFFVLEKLIAIGKKVYVHCKNGHGRAPILVAAYFIKKGKTFQQAIAFIKKKRPTIHLEKIQIKTLLFLERSLNKTLKNKKVVKYSRKLNKN